MVKRPTHNISQHSIENVGNVDNLGRSSQILDRNIASASCEDRGLKTIASPDRPILGMIPYLFTLRSIGFTADRSSSIANYKDSIALIKMVPSQKVRH